jgi:PAS domain S-box-containing protein
LFHLPPSGAPHRLVPLTPSANIERLFENAPGCIAVVRGPDHVFEIANAAYRRLAGRSDLVGRRAADALPELASQGYLALLDSVYESGEPFVADAAPVAFVREPGAEPETRFISFVYQPIRDDAGTVTGIFAEGVDVTPNAAAELARRKAEQALRAREAHLSAFFNQSAAGMSEADASGRFIRVNDRFCAISGRSRQELLAMRMQDITHPHDLPENLPKFQDAAHVGGSFEIEKRYLRPDGRTVWVHNSVTTVRSDAGAPLSTICVTVDITGRRAAEEKLRASEALQRAITEATPECIKIVGGNGQLLHMNRAGLQLVEAESLDAVLGSDTFALIAPEDREAWRDYHARVIGGETLSWEYDAIGLHGTRRRMETYAVPLPQPDGGIAQLAITRDISERKRAEEHQRLLINELNHRVKNTLAIVQGLAHQSFKGHQVPAQVRNAFDGRLAALSAAHNILTEQSWEHASLGEIVEGTIAPYRGRADRIVAEGPDIAISPKTAVNLALALHELATNASKYGALSAAAGRVEIRWRAEDKRLRMVWRESGGPPVEPPATRGFGTRMIERGLASELGGAVKIDFRPEGVVCTLDADLAA